MIDLKQSNRSNYLKTNQNNPHQSFELFFQKLYQLLLNWQKRFRPPKTTFDSFLGRNNKNTFFVSPTSTEEVEDIINSFCLNKALEPSSVPMKMLRDLKKELSKPLTILINLTFSFGIFPNCLKVAKVIPVFTEDPQQECNNYIPISMLSNISKLIKKLLHNRLYSFLEPSINQYNRKNSKSYRRWKILPVGYCWTSKKRLIP